MRTKDAKGWKKVGYGVANAKGVLSDRIKPRKERGALEQWDAEFPKAAPHKWVEIAYRLLTPQKRPGAGRKKVAE